MSQEYVQYEKKGKYHYVKVVQDECCDEGPREWDNLGIMACLKNSRHNFGDKKHEFGDVHDFRRSLAQEVDKSVENRLEHWETGNGFKRITERYEKFEDANVEIHQHVERIISEALSKAVILPLYVYDHSGVTMNTTGFSCKWDSGQVGYIYATPEMILKEFGRKNLTPKLREKVQKILEGEVEAYDQWLTGDIWTIVVEDMYGDTVDAIGDFYGSDYAEKEAKSMLKHADKNGRPKCREAAFLAMKDHEADLRRQYKRLLVLDENPITLAAVLEKAAKVQKDRMKMRVEAMSEHFQEDE